MDVYYSVSMDEILFAIILTFVLREIMVWILPDAIAGPGGWLIDTQKK